MLCHASLIHRKFFSPCPTALTLAMWDIGNWATKLVNFPNKITLEDMFKRESILRQVLSFETAERLKEFTEAYFESSEV